MSSERQYHIALGRGELAKQIILCGDRGRSERAAEYLENITVERHNREYVTYTGVYKGIPVSVMSTGIGPGCMEIALVEIFAIVDNPTFIRVGTCGALQTGIQLGDLVISTGAVRLENTSTFFVDEGYPAVASYEVVLALMMGAEAAGAKYHLGLTASGSGFYGAQGREIPDLPLRYPNLLEQLMARKVTNFEMESSTLFILSTLKGVRASTICTVVAQRPTGQFITPERKHEAERTCIRAGLEAFYYLARMDEQKQSAGKAYWLPTDLLE